MVRESGKNVNNKSPTPKIQKVIFLLPNDKDFEKYYEQRVISLGSIHHGKPKYQLGEKYKLVLTSEFIESNGKSMEEVHKKIQDNIKELRDCFEKEVTMEYNDETKEKFRDLSIKDDSVAFRHQDLFLPENQLPYCLLEWLMTLSKMKKQLEDSMDIFIERFVKVPKDQHSTCWLNWLSTKLWQREHWSSNNETTVRPVTHRSYKINQYHRMLKAQAHAHPSSPQTKDTLALS